VSDESLIAPLAPDCAEMREVLLRAGLPPVWQLDPDEARRLHRQGSLAGRPSWVPPLDSLAVVAVDIAAIDAAPAMRWYRPTEGAADAGITVLWLHGGGWLLGDLDTADATCRAICDLTGWDVLSVDYRCAPRSRFPAAVDDALSAARWLGERCGRVIVAGDSAGANLAGVVAQQLGGLDFVQGQVLVYPCTDPSLSTDSAAEFIDGPFLTRHDMEWFYEQYLGDGQAAADPRVNLMAGLADPAMPVVPAVILTVGHDPLRDEGIEYAMLLQARGHDVGWIHAPELYHGSFSQSGILPSSARRFREVWATAQQLFD
jgi:acetyl esterase